jgi:hypothetical protein
VSDWVKGERVFGELYGGRGTAVGVVLDTDRDDDVRILIESTSEDDLLLGDWCYLRGPSVRRAIEIGLPKLTETLRWGSPFETEPTPVRVGVLRDAETLITGDRNTSYGEPTQNFTDTADVWTTLLRHRLREGERIDAGDVAALMVGLKLVRRTASGKMDHWIDIAGYAACGAEADVSSGRIEL